MFTTSGTVTVYPVLTGNSAPSYITAGPDGALWFTEQNGNNIGRITTAGVVTEYPVPTANSRQPEGTASGPDGALWFTEQNGGTTYSGRITTTWCRHRVSRAHGAFYSQLRGHRGWAGRCAVVYRRSRQQDWAHHRHGQHHRHTGSSITEYPVPSGLSEEPYDITNGPDGALWFTEPNGNRIGRITTSGAITEYVVPTANSSPSGITAGPDGALWFTESGAGQIGRITTAGAITEYGAGGPYSGPEGITAGPDGALWFAEGETIGRITTAGALTQYRLPSLPTPPIGIPTGSDAYAITAGPDGALWISAYFAIWRLTTSGTFTMFNGGGGGGGIGNLWGALRLGTDGALWFEGGRITTSGTVTQYSVPGGVNGITAGPDGALWFTEGPPSGYVGRMTTAGLVSAYQVSTNDARAPGGHRDRAGWRALVYRPERQHRPRRRGAGECLPSLGARRHAG